MLIEVVPKILKIRHIMSKKIKHAHVQPLVGGMVIGAFQVFDTPPEFIITSEFGQSNTQECINYFNNTLKLNVPVINMDAKYEMFMTDKDEKLFNKLNVGIDVVTGLGICSGLSALTTNCSKCKVENPQNENMYNITTSVLSFIKPKVYVMENAPALYTPSGAEVLEKVKDISKEMNYSLTVERVDTFSHGIPQHRQRTFAYFWNDKEASLLEYENLVPKELIDYLKEIPKSATAQALYFRTDKSHKDANYEFCESLCNETESIPEMMKRHGHERHIGTSALDFIQHNVGFEKAVIWAEKRVIESNEEKQYVKALKEYKRIKEKVEDGKRYFDMSSFVGNQGNSVNAVTWKMMGQQKHPELDRPITLREHAHLMGLPHDYELSDWSNNAVMISQNVPVGTSRHVANQCKLYTEAKLKKSYSWFVKQNNVKQRIDFQEPVIHDIEEW